jgi:hypothetical protein
VCLFHIHQRVSPISALRGHCSIKKPHTMAYNEQEREPSQRTRVLRAESNARLSSTATTDSVGSSHIEPVLPSTTLVAATLTDSIPVDQPTSTQVPSQPPPLSSNLSINILASPPHTSSTASPHVPSESDVPEKWAPVYLDGEKDRQFRFLGGMTLVCVLTVVGMIAIGWWR